MISSIGKFIVIVIDSIMSLISKICEPESPFVNGEIELDESYFGVRGKRGRGANGKTPVFGM